MPVYTVGGISAVVEASMVANVKNYGAIGDGVTDDAAAIQSALDTFSLSGGIIFFPNATYLVKSPVKFYSNQTLWFENGARLLQGAAIDNIIRSKVDSTAGGYTGIHDVLIYGGIFDGGYFTTNNSPVAFCHGQNITFENCKFINAYGKYHNLEINSSRNVKILNCEFEGSRKNNDHGELIQIDGAGLSSWYPWDNCKMDNTVSTYVEIAGCYFHDCTASPAIGNHSELAHKYIRIHDCIFDGFSIARGAMNFVLAARDIDIYNNSFINCSYGVRSLNNGSATAGNTYYIHDNRFIGVTSVSTVSNSVVHNNMVNGTYTA